MDIDMSELPEGFPEPVLMRLVCATEGCMNQGVEIELHVFHTAVCGPCGQPIEGVPVNGPASPDQDHSATSLSTT